MDSNILKTIADLQLKMNNISENISSIRQKINSIELDTRRCLKANTPIPPGIGCKFAYDQNGLILKTLPLSQSDIPQLEIDRIKGLKDLLNDKFSKNEFEKLITQVTNSIIHKSDEIYGTGCKINFDKNGFVISTSELSKEDIPILDMEGINGLLDRLKLIESSIKSNHLDDDTFKINSGEGCKISFDSKGRVIKGEKLSINDIPLDLINRINIIESNMLKFGSQQSIDILNEKISKKIDSNNSISSGTFTKITFDKNGLIIKGESLSKEDLPTLNITDINGLNEIIKDLAKKSEIITLSESIDSLTTFITKVGDVLAMKNSLNNKADKSEIDSLKLSINSIKGNILEMNSKIPYDTINSYLEKLDKQIIDLSGRISVIEKKLDINI